MNYLSPPAMGDCRITETYQIAMAARKIEIKLLIHLKLITLTLIRKQSNFNVGRSTGQKVNTLKYVVRVCMC